MAKPTQDYKSISDSDITTILAEDIHFKGVLTFKTSLMIKGTFEGEIHSDGLLLVGEKACVNAKIKTNTLISRGKIEGNVDADRSVVLSSTSFHNGDISTPNFIIESDAVFNGQTSMEPRKEFPTTNQEAENG